MGTINGTPDPDNLSGTPDADHILGGDGNDQIFGGAGDDLIEGGDGDDHLDGGDGSDELHGGEGNDSLQNSSAHSQPGPENDRFYGEGGDDNLYLYVTTADAATVVLDGGTGNDRVTFDAWYYTHNVTLVGGDGDDVIYSIGGKTLSIDAGAGADHVAFNFVGGMGVTVTLGAGADVVELRRGSSSKELLGSVVTITDFQAGAAGDRLFVESYLTFLTGWNPGTNPFGTGHLALEQRGGDSVLKIDFDGGGDGFKDFVLLQGVSAASLSAYNIGFAPDGGSGPGLTLDGDSGGNELLGTGHGDLLRGLAGDDIISGYSGDDRIEGGAGNDVIDGGLGDDLLYGEGDDDVVSDQSGGNDRLYGGDGNDRLTAERSSAIAFSTVLLDGGAGDDQLRYAPLNSVPYRRNVDDVTMLGGDGNDSIYVSSARNAVIDAGSGNDSVSLSNVGTAYTIALGSGSDTLSLGNTPIAPGALVVTDFETGVAGDSLEIDLFLRSQLVGWDPTTHPYEQGFLQLVQRGTDAVLLIDKDGPSGSAAFVDLILFRNADSAAFVTGNLGGYSMIVGTAGDDRLEGTTGIDIIRGLGGNDVLLGGSRADTLEGGAGDDTLEGGDGNYADRLDGGLGADRMTGGAGDDVYIVDDPGDQVLEYGDPWGYEDYTKDEVRTSLPVYTLPANAEVLTGTGAGGQAFTANDRPNLVRTGDGNDVVILLGGNDQAFTAGGNDRIEGGDGNDFLSGGPGDDEIYGGAGDDYSYAGTSLADTGSSGDYVDGGPGNDTIQDGYGDDVLIGGDGNDYIRSEAGGADRIEGGEGDDYITVFPSYAQPPATATLLGGAGNDSASIGLPGSAAVVADMGEGDDLVSIFENRGTVTLTLGAGSDTLSFPGLFPSFFSSGKVIVTDFQGGSGGDKLDLATFLRFSGNWNGASNPFESGYLRLVQSGTSALLQFDKDGGGDSYELLITFLNTDAATFTAQNLGGFASPSVSGTAGGDIVRGSPGDDKILGQDGNDFIDLRQGGDDVASGGSGNDVLYYGGAFSSADRNDGGAGTDAVILQGSFAGTLGADSLTNVEALSLQSGTVTRWGGSGTASYDYDVTAIDANVGAGRQLIVNASALVLGEDFRFDGSAESDGSFFIYAGAGRNDLVGGAQFDTFFFEGNWSSDDVVDGGAGRDVVIVTGGSAMNHVTIGSGVFHNVEAFTVSDVFVSDRSVTPSYDIVIEDGNVVAGGSLIVNGSTLTQAFQTFSLDAHAVTGNLQVYGGSGTDTIVSGSGNDFLYGGDGGDVMTGGSGADVYHYRALSESAPGTPDRITDFLHGTDRIDLAYIDADTVQAGNQAFTFRADGLLEHAGDLRVTHDGTNHWYLVEADVNGDGQADFAIEVVSQGDVPLTGADFIP